MSEQPTLFAVAQLPEVEPAPKKTNPCIDVWGMGPSGKQCGTCAFFVKGMYHTKMLYKCKKRRMTHSERTDHKVHWPSCAKYEERKES